MIPVNKDDNLITDEIGRLMREKLGLEVDSFTDNSNFKDDLGIDSLDLIELRMEVEKEFSIKIPEETAESLSTVGSLIAFVREKKN